jgi:hypothetical protein
MTVSENLCESLYDAFELCLDDADMRLVLLGQREEEFVYPLRRWSSKVVVVAGDPVAERQVEIASGWAAVSNLLLTSQSRRLISSLAKGAYSRHSFIRHYPMRFFSP